MEWGGPAGGRHILYAGGKRDFLERHAESYHRMRARGFGVTALDWRDQGLSARGSVPARRLFDRMEEDFALILEGVAERHGGAVTVMAHSMGGHMVLRTLAQQPRLRPLVERMVLFAPMVGIGGRTMPLSLLSLVADLNVLLGRGGKFPPGQIPYGPEHRSELRRKRLTGDRARFDEGFAMLDANPPLAAGGATWGWLAAALESCRLLHEPGALEAVDIPALLLLPELEMVVDPYAIREAATRLPQGRLLEVEGGRHELQLETDKVQDSFWPVVWDFLGA